MKYSGFEIFKMLYKWLLIGNYLNVIMKFLKYEFFIIIVDELMFNLNLKL